VKWVGVCLLMIAFAIMGLLLSANYKSRIRELEQWLRALKHLEREICFAERVLAEGFARVAEFSSAKQAKLFLACSKQMLEENICFMQAWQNSWRVYLLNSNLTLADRQILQDFILRLGKGDMENQKHAFEFLYRQLDDALCVAKETYVAREKICRCLIWAGGMALVLIFY